MPTATYRLQLRKEFPFTDAARVVPYLADLGVSHVYCSPVLEATPGSAHGYDVVDHSRLSPELGGDAGWAELVRACRTHGLGIVVDVVPNHMAVPTPERLNTALWEVLRAGRESAYAEWFDIDWDRHGGRVLLPVLGAPLEECLAGGDLVIDGDAGVVRYFDHEFPLAPGSTTLEQQHYLLAHWRRADTELNYRRFFDVTALIGLRAESDAVFEATHRRLLDLVTAGEIDGLRIDHPDGLADPGGYLERLVTAAPGAWTVVEKILEPGETLPRSWRCAGTTGYDAVTAITQLLVDPAGETPMTDVYTSLTGMPASFEQVVEESKRLAVTRLFPAEVDRLVRELAPLTGSGEGGSRFTPEQLRGALVELLVAFDVYRAYAGDPASAERIDAAAATARSAAPHLADAVEWLTPLLHRRHPGADAFAVRFEQTTGPVMAKGVEDTAFYRYHRLVALNEVGGSPGRFGMSVASWHEHCGQLAEDWPTAMTTLTTHDTKRSEDVRARLLVLAEIPDVWESALMQWRKMAAEHQPPDANTDYLFWQTLVGAWPIELPRTKAYLEKASREAKLHTSWTDPDDAYDASLQAYVEAVYADRELMSAVGAWVAEHLEAPGASNASSQKLLQLTMPGVPDVYQGQELTEPALVDPDNRRPVDYERRRAELARLTAGDPAATKLRITAAALRLRRERPEAFAAGYAPVEVHGEAVEHAVAFRRGDDVVSVVTRLPAGLARRGGWGDTAITLPPGTWHDVLTGRAVDGGRLRELLAELPVALLTRPAG